MARKIEDREMEWVDADRFTREGVDPDAGGCSFAMELSLLAWLMTGVVREGRRISPTLSLWHDGLGWRLSLHDRAHQLVSYVSGETLGDALALAAKRIRSESLDWRPTRQ